MFWNCFKCLVLIIVPLSHGGLPCVLTLSCSIVCRKPQPGRAPCWEVFTQLPPKIKLYSSSAPLWFCSGLEAPAIFLANGKVCIPCFDHFRFLVVQKTLEGEEQVSMADKRHYCVSLSTMISCGRVFKYCFSPGMQYWYPLLTQTAAQGIVIPCRIPLTIYGVCTVDT